MRAPALVYNNFTEIDEFQLKLPIRKRVFEEMIIPVRQFFVPFLLLCGNIYTQVSDRIHCI
ncbi:MAG: hypothetical protein ACXVBX_07325, partial [Flavisolibacter sp.]